MPAILNVLKATQKGAALVLMIGVTNLFDRLNATTKQIAGGGW
jgi:hypothetical protein